MGRKINKFKILALFLSYKILNKMQAENLHMIHLCQSKLTQKVLYYKVFNQTRLEIVFKINNK